MASRMTQEKAELIAKQLILNNFDKAATLIACGYSPLYAKCGRREETYNNVLVKAEIAKIKAETEEKYIIDRDKQLKHLIEVRNEEHEKGLYSALNTTNDQINKNLGLYEADNEQRKEQNELDLEQQALIEEFMAFRRLKMLNVS